MVAYGDRGRGCAEDHDQRGTLRAGVLLGVPLEELLDGRWIGVGIHDKSRIPRTDPNSKSNFRIQDLHAEHLYRPLGPAGEPGPGPSPESLQDGLSPSPRLSSKLIEVPEASSYMRPLNSTRNAQEEPELPAPSEALQADVANEPRTSAATATTFQAATDKSPQYML